MPEHSDVTDAVLTFLLYKRCELEEEAEKLLEEAARLKRCYYYLRDPEDRLEEAA